MPFITAAEPRDVVLRDGSTLHVRQACAADRAAVLELLEQLSYESLYYRFAGAHRPTEADATRFCGLDENGLALVAERGEQIVAVAQYCIDPEHHERAEVGFTVADSFHGRGVGTRLLERLADVARERGIRTFEAYVLTSNRAMQRVFSDSGFEVQGEMSRGVSHVMLSLDDTERHAARAATRASIAATASMRPFFYPNAVAVVGAGRTRGGIGSEVLHNLTAGGFRGRVVPVNPHAAEINGQRCYRRVDEIPGDIDLAIVAVPAACVESVVDDCIAKGVRALIVITAGFGETGLEGRAQEAAILAKVRAAGIRMIGPNCMGVVNTDPAVSLTGTFAPVTPFPGRVAFSSQSGALGVAILEYARDLNLGVSTFVSVGNKADVSSNDLLLYWSEDDRTDVILLYLESFGNPQRFSRIARHVSRRKPIVAVKSGRSQSGARAASSHTGALAATDRVVDAMFKQAGVIRTDTLEELFDVAALLAHQPLPAGPRVAVLTNAGGPGILAADACEARGLTLPPLAPATAAALRAFLPAAASVGNPVDMLATASAADYERAIPLLLADPGIDALLVLFIPPLVTNTEDVAAVIAATSSGGSKPVLATFLRAEGAPSELTPVPCYRFPEAAARALAHAVDYSRWRKGAVGTVRRYDDVQPLIARQVIDRALAAGEGWLNVDDARSVLSSFGIAVAPTITVNDDEAAVDAAGRLGYPVVLKATGPTLLHKTEECAVALDLRGADDVRQAYRDFKTRLGDRVVAVTVQPMISGASEMFVGAAHESTFGHVVLCGSGGTLLELMNDVACGLHPLTDVIAQQMLDELRGISIVRGFRGGAKGDERGLHDLLLRVSALLETYPEILELDLNPVMVMPDGVRVVDFRIRVGRELPRAPSRRVEY